MKILCTADIHIGRRPSRLPAHIDSAALACAKTWLAITEKAIAEQVDLVAVAGDLVDEANRFYEAAGPVESGVRALASHGIRTVAVAGNHDHDTLGRIADGLPPGDFTLLGRGGRWERMTLERDGAQLLHVDGWSFPAASHRDDPLRDYPRPPGGDGLPVLGLLHADLDQPGSRHAPCALADLRAQPVGFWLLGHVHKPALHEQPGGPAVLYPGSPQGMDPGESGVHGVWMTEVDAGGRFISRPLPLAQVRYDTLEVDVAGVTEEGEVDRRVVDAVSAAVRQVEEGAGPLRYLSFRVRLVGRTPLHRTLQARGEDIAAALELPQGSISALVERVESATRPPRDLERLARGEDAPALLARLARNLERGELDPEGARLLQGAVLRTEEVHAARPYLPLREAPEALADEQVRAILGEQALLLLDELLASKGAS